MNMTNTKRYHVVQIRLTAEEYSQLRRRAVWHDEIAGREAAAIVSLKLADDRRRRREYVRCSAGLGNAE